MARGCLHGFRLRSDYAKHKIAQPEALQVSLLEEDVLKFSSRRLHEIRLRSDYVKHKITQPEALQASARGNINRFIGKLFDGIKEVGLLL